jgi:hypothetical protein
MTISEITNPVDRYLAFLVERDAIYQRKSSGQPWPWTDNPILQEYRFTEVYRERDRTSIHYQKTVRHHYKENPLVLPATVLYRWFNRMSTCDELFNQTDIEGASVFERYINGGCKTPIMLTHCIDEILPPHVTGAYIINGAHGQPKAYGVISYFHDWCQKPWRETWETWLRRPPLLSEMYDWLREDSRGLGSFMAAQLVADLKYLPFMLGVEDWWTWASPGPGSMKGLNIVNGRPMGAPWKNAEWLTGIQELRLLENEKLKPHGLGPFHAQDTQNHTCEFSKFEKVRTGVGRPRQIYRV